MALEEFHNVIENRDAFKVTPYFQFMIRELKQNEFEIMRKQEQNRQEEKLVERSAEKVRQTETAVGGEGSPKQGSEEGGRFLQGFKGLFKRVIGNQLHSQPNSNNIEDNKKDKKEEEAIKIQ